MFLLRRGFLNSFDSILSFLVFLFCLFFAFDFIGSSSANLVFDMAYFKSFVYSFYFSDYYVRSGFFDYSEKRHLANVFSFPDLGQKAVDHNFGFSGNCFSFRRIVMDYFFGSKKLVELPFCR